MAPLSPPPDNGIPPAFFSTLQKHSKPKSRSSVTHEEVHAPILAKGAGHGQFITTLLLGDSMLERFKTTGASTVFGQPANQYDPTTGQGEFFNAGVGGDRICNVIYRLTDKGLLEGLRKCGVRYAILMMGTNDLAEDKKPLQQVHIEQYELIIDGLKRACPEIKMLVSGINPKRRVKKEGIVDASNELLRAMAGDHGVEYVEPNLEIIENLEDDGVHLNEKGYELFAARLCEAYQHMKDQ